MSLTAAASTIFLMINFLIALSFGTHRLQLVQLTFTTCPLPCFERPPFLRFFVYFSKIHILKLIVKIFICFFFLILANMKKKFLSIRVFGKLWYDKTDSITSFHWSHCAIKRDLSFILYNQLKNIKIEKKICIYHF